MINRQMWGIPYFQTYPIWQYPARKWEIWVWPWVAIITSNCFGDSCSLRAPHFGTETYIHRIHVSRRLGWRCWRHSILAITIGIRRTMVLLNFWSPAFAKIPTCGLFRAIFLSQSSTSSTSQGQPVFPCRAGLTSLLTRLLGMKSRSKMLRVRSRLRGEGAWGARELPLLGVPTAKSRIWG
jgi:hypothetical protein